jgi:hypothetical protein
LNLETIERLLAPVVLISACGLLAMAQYNRLAAIVARIRQYHHERVDVFRLMEMSEGDDDPTLRLRFDGVYHQACHMLRRARLTRNALIGMVSCVLLMLACSLAIGASAVWPEIEWVVIALFVAGLVSMFAAMVLALLELRISLQQVEYEHKRMGLLDPQERAGSEHAGDLT